MDAILKILEKILTSILVSVILAILSFSFFTGKFPPRKADMVKAFQLTQSLLQSAPEANALTEQVQKSQAQGGMPNLEQMAEFQRLSLKRTEISIELLALFPKVQLGAVDPELATKLQKVSNQMSEIERTMADIASHIQSNLPTVPPTE